MCITFIWTALQVNIVDKDVMYVVRRAGFVGHDLKLYHSVNKSNCRVAPRTDRILLAEEDLSTLLKFGIFGRPSENPQLDFRRGNPVLKEHARSRPCSEDVRLQRRLVVAATKYRLEEICCTKHNQLK